jgi:hypothetical protein
MASMALSDVGARADARALCGVLQDAGQPAEVLRGPAGTLIVVLPHGGRVIGVFSPGHAGNLVWNNPALADARSARGLFQSDAWCNPGGDRTWLAPEADFFLPRYPDTSSYFQPRQLDPGAYACTRRGGALTLSNDLTLRSYRTGEDVRLRITKRVTALGAAGARRGLPVLGARGVRVAGYTLACTLDVLNDAPRTPVSLWNLLQLPLGGRMLIPTRGQGGPVRFFGTIPEGDLASGEGLIRWTMSAEGEQKIGVSREDATGRVCHLREAGGRAVLAVRDFTLDPAGLYVDAPWPPMAGPACPIQACNVHSALGRFNELEYHAPAIGGSTGRRSITDTSRVRFFHGEAGPIQELAVRLLGVDRIR